MKKILIILMCSISASLFLGQMFAQEQPKHEFSVTGGLGLSTLDFDMHKGDLKHKFGGLIGIGYNYYINSSFSINTGLEITTYNADATLRSFTDSYQAVDTEGDFIFNTSVSDYKEKQRSTYLNIPIMGQYQLPVIEDHKFFVALGGKIGIPVSSSFKTSGAAFETSGTYPEIAGSPTITDTPGLGFYKFTGRKVDKDLDFKVSFMLSIETGMKWSLPSSRYLYTGFYFDYGLNDIRKSGRNQQFLVYQSPDKGVKAENFHLNSMLQSQVTENGKTTSMTDKVIPMALGFKVRFAFSMP